MTVLLPGMTEDDDRVKISSLDNHQQGLLDSWKSKVSLLLKQRGRFELYLWIGIQVFWRVILY